MTYPIPGVGISTPYGKRGSHWSCNPNSSGGVHTGCDFAAGAGTNIYAPIAGQIRHRNYGSAFGNHQFVISPDPGQPFADGEVFFAHTPNRLADGIYVAIGDYIADVGAEGNVTGAHLHYEYHPTSKGTWSCSVHANPQPTLDHSGTSTPPGGEYPIPTSNTVYLSKLHYGQEDSDSVWYLQSRLNGHSIPGGQTIPTTGNYYDMTDQEVRLDQTHHGSAWGEGQADSPGKSTVGPSQAGHLFGGSGITVVNDL